MTAANWFIGLPVAGDCVAALRAAGPGAPVRWVPAGDLHVTVAFLGAVGEAAARRAWATVGALPGTFELALGSLALFGPPRRFSAVGFEPMGPGRAAAVACIEAARARALAAAGARPDARAPRPHVTVLRPRAEATAAERAAIAAWVAAPRADAGAVRVDRVALFTWAADQPRRLFRVVEARALG
ncbi:MAG: 2'-5' RNA ligase family protein [Myxococcales bacterium]|nr:2'-5' RNA ligase family protein [Myxococcales bacterium]